MSNIDDYEEDRKALVKEYEEKESGPYEDYDDESLSSLRQTTPDNYGEENITQGKENLKEIQESFSQESNSESFQEEINSQNEEIEIPEEELEDYKPSQISKGIRRPTKNKSLSDKDLFRRTTSIFEQVKDIKVSLLYTKDTNMVYPSNVVDGKKNYTINIASPAHKAIPKYTALNHELAHLAFDTFMGETSKVYFSKKKDNLPEGYAYNDYAQELYDMSANVLEDERIESKLGDLYLGTNNRFLDCKEKLGKELGEQESPDPASALLATRFGRSDLVPKEWREACKEAIDGVHMTDKYGLLVVGNKYIDTVLNPWLIENGKVVPKKDGRNKMYDDDSNKGDGEGKIEKARDNARNFNQKCDHRYMKEDEEEDDPKGEMPSLEESKEEGEKENDDVRKKIEENSQQRHQSSYMPEDCGTIKQINRYDSSQQLEYNMSVARGLNRIFRELQSKNKYRLYETGDQLDIGAVIRKKARGFGDVFRQKRITSDLTILVSIDVSGSMNGEPVQSAAKMCATVFKAIEGVKGINFYAFGWNGSYGSLDVNEIKDLKGCKGINTNGGGGGTPTQEAMAYSVARLIQMKGKRKVLIFITDGEPSNGAIGRAKVQKWVKEARRRGYVVIGMYPAGYATGGQDFGMENMFGKGHYMIYENMDKASGEVLGLFKKLAMTQIKGR